MAVLSPEQRERYKRRIQTQLGWQDASIQRISQTRFEKRWKADDELHRLWRTKPRAAAIKQRTTELAIALDPHALHLCGHHIEQAIAALKDMDIIVDAPMDRLGREHHGNGQHRVRVLRNFPDRLRSRLSPVFEHADLWDGARLFGERFDTWAAEYQADLPPQALSRYFPEAVEVYRQHRGELASLLDEMVELFAQPDEPEVTHC
jgi:hypothetical protein